MGIVEENKYELGNGRTIWLTDDEVTQIAVKFNEPQHRTYGEFTNDTKERLGEVLDTIMKYMTTELHEDASSMEWRELYVISRQLHGMVDQLTLNQRHTYPPF